MVLSIIVHELLSKQSKYNLTQDDYKSLIPQNDIPDKKIQYHKSMEKVEEKTIELGIKKSKKKVEEIKVKKDDEDKVEVDDFSFEEIIQVPDGEEETSNTEESDEELLQFKLDEEMEDDGKEMEDKDDTKEVEDKEDDKEKLPEQDLMLDLINIIEEKNKKEKKEDKEKSVEIKIDDDNDKDKDKDENIDEKNKIGKEVKKIEIEVDVPEQTAGSVKRIKLDQHYNFF